MVTLILTCAGKGERAKFGKNKLLVSFDGKTVLDYTLTAFMKSGLIDEYIITASKDDIETVKNAVGKNANVVLGGKTRTQSIKNALPFVHGDTLLIHDGARPFVSIQMIKNCILTAQKYGSAIPLLPSRDTIVKSDGKVIDEYKGKDGLYNVQTPQGFKTDLIKAAYEYSQDKTFPDDGAVYKNLYGTLYSYDGEKTNIKLTYPEDFEILKEKGEYKIGCGFDCHKLVENRKLILGGIEIPHSKGLLGHSDADVLVHAIMDAMLSAVSERDIGYHFPDSDPKYKDANSINLLKEVINIIYNKGYKVSNISATIMAQKPKLLDFIPIITENIASVLKIDIKDVGIGATTLEGLGFVGREEGICVNASVMLIKI